MLASGNPKFLVDFSQLSFIKYLLTPFGEGFSFDNIGLLVGLGLGILALVTGLGYFIGLDLLVGVMGGHDGLQKPQLP